MAEGVKLGGMKLLSADLETEITLDHPGGPGEPRGPSGGRQKSQGQGRGAAGFAGGERGRGPRIEPARKRDRSPVTPGSQRSQPRSRGRRTEP